MNEAGESDATKSLRVVNGVLVLPAAVSLGDQLTQKIGFGVGIVASLFVAWLIARRRLTDPVAFAALVPASLFLLVHLSYDYVLLLVPLAATFTLGKKDARRRLLSLGSIALLWFVMPSIFRAATSIPHLPVQLSVCALLILLIVCHLPSNHAGPSGHGAPMRYR